MVKRQLPSVDPSDPEYRRLRYVRYADDFLLSFAGPKREAEEIKVELRQFLSRNLGLELSEEKTVITHAVTQAARFLGYEIQSQHCDTKLDRTKARSVNGVLALKMPRDVIDAACNRYMRRGKPTHRPEIAADSDFDIVQQYQWHYAGLVNYYALAQNIGSLSKLRWVMQTSLLRTLANKHKSSVVTQWRRYRGTVQTEHGPRRCVAVIVPRPGKNPLVARFGGLPLRRKKNAVLIDQVPIRRPPHTELLDRFLADQCEVCGSHEHVEVHHVRKLADLKVKGRRELPDWAKIMVARHRKTLVLCQACHIAVHAGRPLPQAQSR